MCSLSSSVMWSWVLGRILHDLAWGSHCAGPFALIFLTSKRRLLQLPSWQNWYSLPGFWNLVGRRRLRVSTIWHINFHLNPFPHFQYRVVHLLLTLPASLRPRDPCVTISRELTSGFCLRWGRRLLGWGNLGMKSETGRCLGSRLTFTASSPLLPKAPVLPRPEPLGALERQFSCFLALLF